MFRYFKEVLIIRLVKEKNELHFVYILFKRRALDLSVFFFFKAEKNEMEFFN